MKLNRTLTRTMMTRITTKRRRMRKAMLSR